MVVDIAAAAADDAVVVVAAALMGTVRKVSQATGCYGEDCLC